jgi:hypothetical protein
MAFYVSGCRALAVEILGEWEALGACGWEVGFVSGGMCGGNCADAGTYAISGPASTGTVDGVV